MAKKKKKPNQQPLSPKKYILTRARLLPIYKCLVNKNWNESKMASIIVTRKHSNGNITAGFFLVDMMGLGVKDTHYLFNEPEDDFFEDIYDRQPEHSLEEISYPLAHNIIYGGVAFAEEHNFPQHSDFGLTQYILEEDTDEIELIELEFGMNGKPFIIHTGISADEDDLDDEDSDDDEESDESPSIRDFQQWNDTDWKNFFNTGEMPPPLIFLKAVAVLFDRWFGENHPDALWLHRAVTSLKHYEITYDDIDPYYFKDQELPVEAEKIAEELSSAKTYADYKTVNKKLRALIASDPENPVYHNFLAICAGESGDPGFREIVEQMVKKFPDYPYSKIALANALMDAGEMEAAEKLFNNHYTLPDLVPNRKTFHIAELIGFNTTMMRLFLHKEDIASVHVNYEIMNALDDDRLEDTDLFIKVGKMFLKKKAEIVMRYIVEKGYVTEMKRM